MKKQLLFALAIGSAFNVFAQLPVSTAPENKKVVLEEFTGVYCGYCPDGHEIANTIHDADPDNVLLANIHAGSFANVAVGEPDFKTAEGTAINNIMAITGYPAGSVNRRPHTTAQGAQTNNGMAGGRGAWTNWANSIKTEAAYCNVALEGSLDVQTRVLTVKVEVYYTDNSPVASNKLNVYLLEDSVLGPQHNYGNPYYNLSNYNSDGTYNHNHVLRKALTGNFGQTISDVTQGTTYTTTISYTIPQTYGAAGKTTPCALGNLHMIAFVTENNNKEVINGNRGPISLENYASVLDASPIILKADNFSCIGSGINASFRFTNLGSDVINTADFEYRIDNTTIGVYTWNGTILPQTVSHEIALPPITGFNAYTTNTVVIKSVAINGHEDQNIQNSYIYKQVSYNQPAYAGDLNLDFVFTQDQYGSESTWYIVDAATSNTIANGGPYSNLAASGVQSHTTSFIADPSACYQLYVYDAYGDGINAGYGAGGYNLYKTSDYSQAILTSNGTYGAGDVKPFSTEQSGSLGSNPNSLEISYVGIATQNMNINSVNLYPNPAKDLTNLSVELSQNEIMNITVINTVGQTVYSVKAQEMKAGSNNVTLNTANWASGVYFINVSSAKGSISKKLAVSNK